MKFIAVWIIIVGLSFVNQVKSCCDMFSEKDSDEIDKDYNVHIPSGKESYLNDTH